MAERDASKSRKGSGRSATTAASRALAGDQAVAVGATDEPRAIAAERDKLKLELDTALERIQALEGERKQLADRVAWAMDTLRTLLDESA